MLRNPIFFLIFQGGPDPLSPPLDPHMCQMFLLSAKPVLCAKRFRKEGNYLLKCPLLKGNAIFGFAQVTFGFHTNCGGLYCVFSPFKKCSLGYKNTTLAPSVGP